MGQVTPFLMFQGNAEQAITDYTSIIEDSEITSLIHYGDNGPGEAGKVMRASFTLKGLEVLCIDSMTPHSFEFTPSFSLFVNFDSEQEINQAYARLVEGGNELMLLGNHGFSRKFGWLNDKYGVSWQLNLQ